MNQPGFFARVFIWLSGASDVNLRECPPWEVRKYVAFGATVLVPCVFAFIAAAYAISTLTTDWNVIFGVAGVWAFIILTVDRALLATYRAYQSFFRKVSQFFLRLVVAGLMGITISHPLTLLLFKDTIASVIEKDREIELNAVRTTAVEQKKVVEEKITALDGEIAKRGRSGTRASVPSSWWVTRPTGRRNRSRMRRGAPRRNWRSRSPRPRPPRWKS
ncbi:DUF4407 domain-containing protein [Verrucomicrobium spinosum]|uniref:DUF4407 domain-containing protein n=1 Tax=Verrucomicrobium spinosum TaxID=2736 RepID=UPI000946441F|nr:DUF4407 domain-containing protein [Verrucomicrobium spinosum]